MGSKYLFIEILRVIKIVTFVPLYFAFLFFRLIILLPLCLIQVLGISVRDVIRKRKPLYKHNALIIREYLDGNGLLLSRSSLEMNTYKFSSCQIDAIIACNKNETGVSLLYIYSTLNLSSLGIFFVDIEENCISCVYDKIGSLQFDKIFSKFSNRERLSAYKALHR